MGSVTSLFAHTTGLLWLVGGCVLLVLVIGLSCLALLHRSRSRMLAATAQLSEMRGRDQLTGLMTRHRFEAELDEAALNCDRASARLAVLTIGLDNFRALNDGYGHEVGDTVLIEAARRLQSLAGPRAAVSRLGGDEFALFVRTTWPEAGRAATAVLEVLQRPFQTDGLELQLSASVGIAVYPDHASRPRLLAHAALAMRSVKQVGGASHAHYDPAMAVNQREQSELLQDLRHALVRKQLQLYYQPKIDAHSLQITGAEALLRWQHPQRGLVSPAVFVPLAERHGLIGVIGRWVIDEACRQAAEWRDMGLRMRVAVNISGHQLRQDDLVEHIQAALARHGIPPARLTCEITETVAMEDTSHTRAAFERLRHAGLHVSIDDFGTGHSSLAALRRLPAAELKIDRGFVSDLATVERARSIVLAIVQMAHTLGLRVVAEGVETEAQRDALVALGCDELQGYLFAKAMTARSMALWADDDGVDGARPMFRPSLFDPTAPAPLGL